MSIYHQIFHPQSHWQSPNNIQLLESFMYLSKPIDVKMEVGMSNTEPQSSMGTNTIFDLKTNIVGSESNVLEELSLSKPTLIK